MSEQDEKQSEKPKSSKKKKIGITILILLGIILLIAGGVYVLGHRYYAKTNYVTDEEIQKQIEEQKQKAPEEPEEEEVVDPELLEAQKKMAQYGSTEPITTDGNVYNVMLVGLDTTKENFVGNSDSMILVSVNYRLHKISMISFMRDLRVNIPGVGFRKLNATYPNGGGPLLTKTIEENFKIDVDRYVTVDFGNMIHIIDEIGTIEITFTEKEAENANKSIKQQCRIMGLKAKDYYIPGEGTYQCNGMQAVAYARIRKVGNADYQRTERQREVLAKMVENVKKMSLDDLDRLATRVLPMLTHNIPESEFWGLLAKAPTLLTYTLEQDRVPYDGMFQSINGNLVPDAERTIRRLKGSIYGEDVIDAEGNLITPTPTATPVPTQADSTATPEAVTPGAAVPDNELPTMESETGTGDPSSKVTVQENREKSALSTLQPEKKAVVVADNTNKKDSNKGIRNPYTDPFFVLRVPNAPAKANVDLVDGSYEWKKKGTFPQIMK